MLIYQSSITYPVVSQLSKSVTHKKPKALISYGVDKNDDYLLMVKKRDLIGSLIGDSGTFSDHTSENQSDSRITFPGYSGYLRACRDKYDFYFNYDKDFTISGFEENLSYLLELEKLGFAPVPVIHDYYDEETEFYIDQGYKMVALGSVMEEGENKFLRIKDDVVKAAWKLWENRIKTHLFASATFGMLHDLPVYSSDASSWAQYAAIGRLLWWNPISDAYDKTEVVRMRDYVDMKPDRNYFYDEYGSSDSSVLLL